MAANESTAIVVVDNQCPAMCCFPPPLTNKRILPFCFLFPPLSLSWKLFLNTLSSIKKIEVSRFGRVWNGLAIAKSLLCSHFLKACEFTGMGWRSWWTLQEKEHETPGTQCHSAISLGLFKYLQPGAPGMIPCSSMLFSLLTLVCRAPSLGFSGGRFGYFGSCPVKDQGWKSRFKHPWPLPSASPTG